MFIFSSQHAQRYYTKDVALTNVIQQSTHKTKQKTQSVIQKNTTSRSREHVHKRAHMKTYRLRRMFIEFPYVTVIKLNDEMK